MAAEAVIERSDDTVIVTTPAAGYSPGEVTQLPDGRAGVLTGLTAKVSGEPAAFRTRGQYTLQKSTGVVCLKGGRAFWDRSANTVSPLQPAAGADYFIGTFVADAAAADTEVVVDLNAQPNYVVDLHRDAFETIVVRTAGTPDLRTRGGVSQLEFSATNEAQKVDLLSVQSVPVSLPWIAEFRFACYDRGDAAALDFNIGVANATHATDADSITESVFIHMDGNSLDLRAESDDGTTEVAATDTTIDAVDDTYLQVWIDGRDKSNVKIYIDGVRVLSSTTLSLAAAAGPHKLLAHLEKTADDTPGDFRVVHAAFRVTDVAS